MSFLDDEAGPESSQAREFYDIVQSAAVTYRIASGQRDIVYGGNTYVATPMARTEISLAQAGESSMTLALPLSHPLCQRYMASGTPPRQVSVTVYRMQLRSGEVETICIGYVTSMAIAGHLAQFLIPSRLSRLLARHVPNMTCGNQCPHTLYDRNCQVVDTGFSLTTTVITFDGRDVVVASAPGGDEYYPYGDLLHVASGERQTIFSQFGTQLGMQAPIPDMKTGDTVILRAGCKHNTSDCFAKFSNMANYGGQPQLPSVDLFVPGNKIGIFGS